MGHPNCLPSMGLIAHSKAAKVGYDDDRSSSPKGLQANVDTFWNLRFG